MSMSTALKALRDWMQTESNITWGNPPIALNKDNCFIGIDAEPQHVTGKFCIVIDDGGVDTTAPENYFHSETYTITIAVWRRITTYAEDRRGQTMLVPNDIYSTYAKSIEQLSRDVITNVHQSYTFLSYLNALVGTEETGDIYRSPLNYRGRGTTSIMPLDDREAFLGRMLRFSGLLRVQRIGEAQ